MDNDYVVEFEKLLGNSRQTVESKVMMPRWSCLTLDTLQLRGFVVTARRNSAMSGTDVSGGELVDFLVCNCFP